jgi:hypothetical protein
MGSSAQGLVSQVDRSFEVILVLNRIIVMKGEDAQVIAIHDTTNKTILHNIHYVHLKSVLDFSK